MKKTPTNVTHFSRRACLKLIGAAGPSFVENADEADHEDSKRGDSHVEMEVKKTGEASATPQPSPADDVVETETIKGKNGAVVTAGLITASTKAESVAVGCWHSWITAAVPEVRPDR